MSRCLKLLHRTGIVVSKTVLAIKDMSLLTENHTLVFGNTSLVLPGKTNVPERFIAAVRYDCVIRSSLLGVRVLDVWKSKVDSELSGDLFCF